MTGPLRYYSDFLYPLNAGSTGTYPTPAIDGSNIVLTPSAQYFFIGFPVWRNMYPLASEFNSLVIEWNLLTMPSGGTYVRLIPFSAKGLISTGQLVPGYDTASSGQVAESNEFSWDYLDVANQKVQVEPYQLEKVTADLNVPTVHILPTIVPYLGFYMVSDGNGNPNPGTQTLYAHMSHK